MTGDDGIAITGDWLLSEGWAQSLPIEFVLRGTPVVVWLGVDGPIIGIVMTPSARWWQCDGKTTRGDLRRLLAAMGITRAPERQGDG